MRIRKWFRYMSRKLYLRPVSRNDDQEPTTDDVCDLYINTKVKRETIRELAYMFGRRVYDDDEATVGIGIFGKYAGYSHDYTPPDISDDVSMEERYQIESRARISHFVNAIDELVSEKVVEIGMDTSPGSDIPSVVFVSGEPEERDIEVDPEHVVSLRRGEQFEYAVQSLMAIDMATGSMDLWENM